MAAITGTQRAAIFGQPGKVDRITVTTPWGMRVSVHRLIADRFLQACAAAAKCAWKPQRVDSYNPRPIRGEDGSDLDEWSLHAWALAWDFFVTPPNVPPPGGVWTPVNGVPADFAKCFTDLGFRWGATFGRKDVPHIEWPGGLPSGSPQEDDMSQADIDELKRDVEEIKSDVKSVRAETDKLWTGETITRIAQTVVALLPPANGGGGLTFDQAVEAAKQADREGSGG